VADENAAINVIRGLAMDAVQRANSGHAGTPMALAPLAHVLWTRVMKYDAADADWPDRDRFVLSAGHASMLLYSMLYLAGFGLELEDLRAFRQWGSKTPGHPERGDTPGVEVTTGPLGQGFANGIGLALSEANLRARFGPEVIDHHVFAICSDGDLEEGISHEAASLAGHLGLGRLVYVYDDNHITIDGPTELALTDDAPQRFEAYGWHVLRLGEVAEDLDAVERGLREAMAVSDRPSLVVLRSHIGYPSPKFTDTSAAHGAPLGAEEVAAVKAILGMPVDHDFWVPDEVLEYYRAAGRRGSEVRVAWNNRRETLRTAEPELADDFDAVLAGSGRQGWDAKLPAWSPGDSVATRSACSDVLDAIVDVVPGLVGGGADLTGNTGTHLSHSEIIDTHRFGGRQIHFGIREHGMGGILNGMAAGGLLPFGGTFFVFSDYMRGSVRLAALSNYRSAFVWSHDSVGLGEDGPTHQPIEHLMSLRAMPGLRLIRPADANETAAAWQVHIDGDGPTAIVVSRQKLPVLEGTAERAMAGVAHGAYMLVEADNPELILVGTGSEVSLCVDVAVRLASQGRRASVVSMPSWDLFAAQDIAYRETVLPSGVRKLAVEAGVTLGWERWTDAAVGIDRFGASAPGATALEELGINPDHVTARALELLEERS